MKTVFFTVAICTISLFGFSQKHVPIKSPEEMADHQTQWMVKEFSLPTQDSAAAYLINYDFSLKMKNLIEDSGSERPDREQMQTLHQEKDSKLKELLTEEQFLVYQQKEEEMRKRHQGNRPGQGRGRGRGQERGF